MNRSLSIRPSASRDVARIAPAAGMRPATNLSRQDIDSINRQAMKLRQGRRALRDNVGTREGA